MKVQVVIPWRDRGTDPRRAANLDVVLGWWYAHGYDPLIVDDGLEGAAQFNRHRAYNRAVSGNPGTDVFVFTEADMLIHPNQIKQAVAHANDRMGLVVPFTEYRYLSDESTAWTRDQYHDLPPNMLAEWWAREPGDKHSIFQMTPESVMRHGKSIGAVNVVSAETLRQTGGFTEATHGNWYDDNIIEEGFAYLTNPTRWVKGPATHLYHLPGWKGDHLSDEDKRATAHNKGLLGQLRRDIKRGADPQVRALMAYKRGGAV